MTVGELIEILKQHPLTNRVVVSGYEGGLDDVEEVLDIVMVEDYQPYCGVYRPLSDYDDYRMPASSRHIQATQIG